ncbi:MAG: TRAP transporter substrate-binding protein DctP [Pseudomonadota bacterium]
MTTRRTFLKAGALGAAALPFMTVRFAQAASEFKAYTYLPTISRAGASGLEQMFKEITEKTGGEVVIELNLGGSLPISGADITQAVGDGVIQFAGNGFFSGSVPIGGILRLPMLLTTRAEFDKAFAIVKPAMDQGFQRQGVTVIGNYLYPLQVAWGRDAIASLDDLKGKKMRVTSPEQAAFMERMGGSGVTIPTPEVTPALQRGVVDGVFTASIGGGAFWKDLLTSNYRLGPNFFDSVIIANSDALDSLSDEQRSVVMSAAAKASSAITDEMFADEPKVTEELAAGGITVTEPSADAVATAAADMAGYWQSWAEEQGGEAPAVLAQVREAVGR